MSDAKTPANPSELARETLRRLAMQRKPPTPDNYRALYHEIAGTQAQEDFPEKAMKVMAASLPRGTAEQGRLAKQFESAATSGSWDSLRAAFADMVARFGAEPPAWSALLHELLNGLEVHHVGVTSAKKREMVEHVLSASASPDLLFSRLQSVIKGWERSPEATSEAMTDAPAEAADQPRAAGSATSMTPSSASRTGFRELQGLTADLIDQALVALLHESPELAGEANRLANDLRAATGPDQVAALAERLRKLGYRLQYLAEDQAELRGALLHLLRLIVENISELVVDDQWLTGQIAVVRDLVEQPLTLRQLDDVERRMKDVIYKQSNLKKSLNEAKDRLKAMLATFVDRLANFSESTSDYHDKIEHCAERITQANDIGELSDVLDEVMRETRVIQLNAQRSRDELHEMRRRVDESEREVDRLQHELAQASEMVRHDPLTGALNRKGMDEAMEKEFARMQRTGTRLSVALLDIDNFKKLNDTMGHAAGDAALVHLAEVVRQTIRPQDTLSRYGGEEFVVVLPDTPLDDGVQAMVRVQRELTRRFFMHNNDKVLITFSCGVAEVGGEEPPHDAVKRADGAMYLAKRAGKNRVVAA